LAPFGSGIKVAATQNIADGQFVNVISEVCQRALDATVTPGWIRFGHLDREPLNLFRYGWPTQLCATHAAIEVLSHEAAIPAQERVGGGKRGDLLEAFPPEWIGKRRKATAFGIGEAEPMPLEFPFEYAVFLKKIRDDLLLVPLQPASNHDDQDVENHGRSSGECIMMRSFGPVYTQRDPLQ
jgi:hypothetical protein